MAQLIRDVKDPTNKYVYMNNSYNPFKTKDI